MTRSEIAKWWMTLMGLLMAGIGVLAMIDRRLIVSDRQLVGRQSDAILSIGDTQAVLDGGIDPFIEAYLHQQLSARTSGE